MESPPALNLTDERGVPLVIKLGSPMWGETAAGAEWHATMHAVLLKCGWSPAEGVPALYYKQLPCGATAVCGTIVDDFLIVEPPGPSAPSADSTIDQHPRAPRPPTLNTD